MPKQRMLLGCWAAVWCGMLASGAPLTAQTLQAQLAAEGSAALIKAARAEGDPRRGAIVFYQPYMACTKCHIAGQEKQSLGPDLSRAGREVTDDYLVESVLDPSKVIKKGFESVTVLTADGKSFAGLIAKDEPDQLVLRDAARGGQLVTIGKDEIDERTPGKVSLMPAGQVNVLASRQQFLDLLRYLIEIRDGGPPRAAELKPAPSLYAARPLPEYEKTIDHAGMIESLDQASFKRGAAIYNRLCINCHGTQERPGSLPTSLRFATGKFKNGGDPFTMYQTLTRGFGMMVPQTWMVPEQKYDVIHYIREAYLKRHNRPQYFAIDKAYLEHLPKGTSRGPKPSNILPWEQMDYGPNLVATYEIGRDGSNFAYKGNAVRLDAGPGGVSQGRFWMLFDYDTMRVAAAWSGKGFIDYAGINFNGRHNVHPRLVGAVHVANPTGPGWANPKDGSFAEVRLTGRDQRRYGPLPRDWAKFRGMYAHGGNTILSYSVGDTEVLEMPGAETGGQVPVFTRTFNIGPRTRKMILQVANQQGSDQLQRVPAGSRSDAYIVLGSSHLGEFETVSAAKTFKFDGATRCEIARPDDFDMHDADYTIHARIKTNDGGTLFAKTAPQPNWVRDGKTLFVRGGRLAFDIGWIGDVQSRRKVNDGRWHNVAMTYQAATGDVQLYIDGQPDGQRRLKPAKPVDGHVVRIGYTASNFPRQRSFFDGEISDLQFYQRALGETEIASLATGKEVDKVKLIGNWHLATMQDANVRDATGQKHDGKFVAGKPKETAAASSALVAGIAGKVEGSAWSYGEDRNLRLHLPAGTSPLKFTLWLAALEKSSDAKAVVSSLVLNESQQDLAPLTAGGPARWPQVLTTEAVIGADTGPFAVDVLTHPKNNPWFCRMRLTGFDFFADGDRAAVCSWDGNVWLVSGLSKLPGRAKAIAGRDGTPAGEGGVQLTWRRIASGLFQPLGLKIVDGKIFVGCRDQICQLHDLNGDGETDYYENFNNDHQVTDHFHEFAMGLQSDAEGNFYYAKSARHALTALVPHHGTLLRVSRDGSKTEILANGFRAANGVCLNPDGTFIVTDQEGHWNPKNRINWVERGGFYGNMFGYHDVEDSSDGAMQQPLCWITNAFDRSPAELLWVPGKAWGPLGGSLLNLSYGYGKVYVVPHEDVGGQKQGGMCQLPLPQFPTGVMRGRFHPSDGQLYACGMFAWGGAQQQAGGFYRVRYTGKPVHLPIALKAKQSGIEIKFSGRLDRQSAANAANYQVKVWSLKRTAGYGSKHYDEHPLQIASVSLSQDAQTVLLQIPKLGPTWCMEIKYQLKSAAGQEFSGVIHNTVHRLGAASEIN